LPGRVTLLKCSDGEPGLTSARAVFGARRQILDAVHTPHSACRRPSTRRPRAQTQRCMRSFWAPVAIAPRSIWWLVAAAWSCGIESTLICALALLRSWHSTPRPVGV
jgi:hypothetical protein